MKLKPIVVVRTHYEKHRENKGLQLMMLKALKITQNPQQLRQMLGLKRVADVFRTLDKMAASREYQKSLQRYGISFDFIVEGLAKELNAPDSRAGNRIKIYEILMKSMGVDTLNDPGDGGTWQEQMMQDDKENIEVEEIEIGRDYEVTPPQIPESVRESKEEEEKLGHELYG